MNRVFLALALVMAPALAIAQPDPNARPMAVNPPVDVNAPPLVPNTPENAARYFIQCASEPSESQLSLIVAGACIGYFGDDRWADAVHAGYASKVLNGRQIDTVNVVQQVGDDSATVEVTMHWEGQNINGKTFRGEQQKYTIQLHRETPPISPAFGGLKTYWRVVPPPIEDVLAKPLDQTPPLELVAAIATHDPRLLPLLQPVEQNPQEQASNQLKHLALGVFQFVQDYEETFAFGDAARERALQPYLHTESLFLIPGTKGEKWHFNDNLSNVPLAKLNAPAKTVLFYDGQAPDSDHLNFRFDGKTLVCFADGHAAALSKDEARGLVWKP